MDDSESTPHHEALLHYGGLTLHLVVLVDAQADLATSYRVTCRERDTGWLLASTLLPAALDGGPPTLTLSDLTSLLGDAYRLASVFVEVESKRLTRLTRRTADRLRRRDRSWLRRARRLLPSTERPLPYESSLERDWLARTDATATFLEPVA